MRLLILNKNKSYNFNVTIKKKRSFAFAIIPRDFEPNKRLINLNVRGKRGNIVQVYPSVEYDYVPNTIESSLNDYIHIQ
jgi:hypothetical protein